MSVEGQPTGSSGGAARVSNGMERLIPIVNRLQDAFNLLGYCPIDLPQIAVVGSQSSGKSSVLENLVGKDFLPRGSGIVTRRPLILQLINVPENGVEYGVFLHKPDTKMYDFAQIRTEIESETDRVAGSGVALSPDPINLKVFSPHVLNLTLVDLPGATKVPVGDQPKDIGNLIRNMILDFIQKPNCIILAVTAANTDLANSDALQLAREVDPNGDRTLGVLTKLDLMDKGTDAMAVLLGQVVNVKLGFVGVVNRSQEDITKSRSIKYARQQEDKFFLTHPSYQRIADRMGTPFLAKRCAEILVARIQNALPEMQSELSSLLTTKRAELRSMKELTDVTSKRKFLLQALMSFGERLRDMLEGRAEDVGYFDELVGGARIEYIFREIFTVALDEIDILDGLSSADINTIVQNVGGLGGGLFIPDEAFEMIVRTNVKRFEDPALQCVELVYDDLVTMVQSLTTDELNRFETLRRDVLTVVSSLLLKCLREVKQEISELIQIERHRINTDHPDFVGRRGNINKLRWEIEQDMKRQSSLNRDENTARQKAKERSRQRCGYAFKKGGKGIAVWQKRWLVLNGMVLTYYKSNGDTVPSGKVALTGCSVDHADGETGKKFSFSIKHPDGLIKKSFFFYAEDETECLKWITSIRAAVDGRPLEEEEKKHEVDLGEAPAKIGKKETLTTTERMDTQIIRRILSSYFDIVRSTIKDRVPKMINLALIHRIKTETSTLLVDELFTEERVAKLSESEAAVLKRKKLAETVRLLEEAARVMETIRNTASLV